MEKLYHLRHPVEAVRTAPYGLGVTALAMSGAGICAGLLVTEIPERNGVLGGAIAVAESLGMAVGTNFVGSGIAATRARLKLKEGIEDMIARKGFDEEAMGFTLPVWGTRQATLVACEKYGPEIKEQYEALIEKNKDNIAFPNLKHF